MFSPELQLAHVDADIFASIVGYVFCCLLALVLPLLGAMLPGAYLTKAATGAACYWCWPTLGFGVALLTFCCVVCLPPVCFFGRRWARRNTPQPAYLIDPEDDGVLRDPPALLDDDDDDSVLEDAHHSSSSSSH